MATTIVFDQNPIFFIQHSYCMLTYTHIFSGVLAGLVIWFGLTLAFIKPPIREVISRTHSNLPLSSNSPTTIVDPRLKDVPNKGMSSTGIELNKERKLQLPPSTSVLTNGSNDFIIITGPFSDVTAPVKVSTPPSLALYPFVRRMSLPRHRPSFCIPPSSSNAAASLPQRATVYRHGSLADDNTSYLPPPHVPSGIVRLISDDDDKKQSLKSVLPESKASKVDADLPKTNTKFKRVKRRVRALFQ